MTMTDPIADMLTRIRNANVAMHDEVTHAVVQAEGGPGRAPRAARATSRASTWRDNPDRPGPMLTIDAEVLAPSASARSRASSGCPSPASACTRKSTEVPRVLGGLGIAVLSTSQGLMTDREARKRRVGGEVLCYVW